MDIIAESPPVFWYAAKELQVEGLIRDAGSPAKAEPCYIAFSPFLSESIDLAEKLSEGIERLSKSGELKLLAKKYGLPETFLID